MPCIKITGHLTIGWILLVNLFFIAFTNFDNSGFEFDGIAVL
jgi:hypothetical protein